MSCLDCGHTYAEHRVGVNGRECQTDGPRCFCQRFNDGSPKPLSLYTREEVVALIREAVAPQNRYARVDAAIADFEQLRDSANFTRHRDQKQIGTGDLIDELRAALHAERGSR